MLVKKINGFETTKNVGKDSNGEDIIMVQGWRVEDYYSRESFEEDFQQHYDLGNVSAVEYLPGTEEAFLLDMIQQLEEMLLEVKDPIQFNLIALEIDDLYRKLEF